MAELYVCSSDDGKNTLRVTSKGDGDCTLELSWKKDDESERITNRVKLSKKAFRGGMYEGGLLERIGLTGKKVAIFDESDGIFLEKEERFKRMNSMVKKTKYRGGMQEYLALKTVRSTIDEASGNFIIFELGLKRCAKQVTSADPVYSNIVQVAPAFTYLDIRQWKDNKATKSGIRIPEVLLLKLMMEKEIGHGQLKDDDEGEDPPPKKRRRIKRRVEEKIEEKIEEGEGEIHRPPPPMFSLTVAQMSRKFLNARVERVRESEVTLKACIKVCHKLLLLKSRELYDGCGINYANILQRMKDASGETPIENIVGAIRDGEVGYEEHHQFDCLVSDPLRFATFHVAFVLALAAMESADSFSKKMLEMDDRVDAESIARLYELIQGAAIGRKKEAKLEGFLFNITSILLPELDPTIA